MQITPSPKQLFDYAERGEIVKAATDGTTFNSGGVNIKKDANGDIDVVGIGRSSALNTVIVEGAGKVSTKIKTVSSTDALNQANKQAGSTATAAIKSNQKATNTGTAKHSQAAIAAQGRADAARAKQVGTKMLNSTAGKISDNAIKTGISVGADRLQQKDKKPE